MTAVRSLAFNLAFYLWTLFAAIVTLPILLAPRPAAQATLNLWAKVVTWLLRVVGGVRVEVRGREHVPVGVALVAPKHQCMFDIFGLIAVLPDSCFVLRKELMRIPVFGWWAWKCDMIVIDREGGSKALRHMLTVVARPPHPGAAPAGDLPRGSPRQAGPGRRLSARCRRPLPRPRHGMRAGGAELGRALAKRRARPEARHDRV